MLNINDRSKSPALKFPPCCFVAGCSEFALEWFSHVLTNSRVTCGGATGFNFRSHPLVYLIHASL